jgi:hypothetical protein
MLSEFLKSKHNFNRQFKETTQYNTQPQETTEKSYLFA